MTGSDREMGGGRRQFKTTQVRRRTNGQSETRIADAATIVVHGLVGSLAT